MRRYLVQAAHYGLGAIFPVVVIDSHPRWHQDHPTAAPAISPEGSEFLALRWTGHDGHIAEAPNLLLNAASNVPHTSALPFHIDSYRDALPPRIRLIALRPSALIGHWSQWPPGNTGTHIL